MIHSLFIINKSGDIFMEKHWKSVISKSVCDYIFEEQKKVSSPEDILPIISTPKYFLANIYRQKLYFVAVLSNEFPALFVIEFLHRIVDTIIDYFQDCNENTIKENYVIIYEVLDEMLDNGFPLATESNILKELIRPPNILRTITNTVTGKSNISSNLPKGQLSTIPWRRIGTKYTNNEAYFDVTEEIDAIIDKFGSIVFLEIQGYIDSSIKLSGMPDLTMTFVNPRLLDDVSFHPCVRYKRWENEKHICFVPPDGQFRLFAYRVSSKNVAPLPFQIHSHISFNKIINNESSLTPTGKIELSISQRHSLGKTIDNMILEITFPKLISNLNLTATQGVFSFDPQSKVMEWDVGKLDVIKGNPQLKGTIIINHGVPVPDMNLTINVSFTIPQVTFSGVKINRLDITGENYKPFKGVKYLTKAGKFQIRI